MSITPEIEALAMEYKNKMKYKKPQNGVVSKACSNLRFLIERIQTGEINPDNNNGINYVGYISRIEQYYETLLTIHPIDFDNEFNQFNQLVDSAHLSDLFTVSVNRHGNSVPPYKKKFYELLVWAMRYGYVQGRLFPEFIRKMGLRTCVYCNAQYAVATKKNDAFYQLDHCYPKSQYPFLSTSFFNLQPSCGACNQRKSGIDMKKGVYDVSVWKEIGDPYDHYFDFYIEDGSLAKYLTSHDHTDLEIELVNVIKGCADLDNLLKQYKERFRIKEVYQEHKEEAEEIVWKKYIYTASYVNSLQTAFENFQINKAEDQKRFLLGTYSCPQDVYKRPLTKMIQDVAKQLKIDELISR